MTLTESIHGAVTDFVCEVVPRLDPTAAVWDLTSVDMLSIGGHRVLEIAGHDTLTRGERPWITNVEIYADCVRVYRLMEAAGDGVCVELADPAAFDQLEAALRRLCRHWRDDPTPRKYGRVQAIERLGPGPYLAKEYQTSMESARLV
ncbi:MAG: hypothetical protein U0871_05265 [Gemmataceae bacterium]